MPITCPACAADVTTRFCGHCGAAVHHAAPVGPPASLPYASPPQEEPGPATSPWAITIVPGARPHEPEPSAATGTAAALGAAAAARAAALRERWQHLDGRARGALAGGAVLGLLALLVPGGDGTALPGVSITSRASHTLTGSFTVQAFNDDSCDLLGRNATSRFDRLLDLTSGKTFPCPNGPGGGYSDIRDGTSVAVTDGAGTLLGTGALESGTQQGAGVTFTFSVPDLPDADFYQLRVANRGELPYRRTDLDAKAWQVSASLG